MAIVSDLEARVAKLESVVFRKPSLASPTPHASTGGLRRVVDDTLGVSLPEPTLKNAAIAAVAGYVGYKYLGGKKLLRGLMR